MGVGVPRNTRRELRKPWLSETLARARARARVCVCVCVCVCIYLVRMVNLTGVLPSWKTAMAKETPSPFCVWETRLKPFFLRN